MPTYVYKFIETGETIEVQQTFDDATLTEFAHPDTGTTMPVKKVFLPVGVTFKGDGFYKTDSRSASKKSAGKGPSESTSNGDSSGSSSSDSSKPSESSESSESSKSSKSSESSESSKSSKSAAGSSSSSSSSGSSSSAATTASGD